MEKELLDMYLLGMDIDLLSTHLNLSTRTVVVKLSELLLDSPNPAQNTKAENYRKPWSWADDSRLWRMYAIGASVRSIADSLGRDELGVCYRLIAENLLIVPKTVVKKYKLDDENFATDSDSKAEVKTCPTCLDVIWYCKCQWQPTTHS